MPWLPFIALGFAAAALLGGALAQRLGPGMGIVAIGLLGLG